MYFKATSCIVLREATLEKKMSQLQTVQMYFPAGLLHNTATNRWHPFFFRLSPRPSDSKDDVAMRFRSAAHHTDGFACLDDAKGYIQEQTKWKDTGAIWDWDGTGIPTITNDFVVDAFLSISPQIEGGSNK